MLDFRDVPTAAVGTPPVALPAASLGAGLATYAEAKIVIGSGWGAWFAASSLPAASTLQVDLNAVAAALAADTKGAMPNNECLAYCRIYLSDQGGHIVAQPWLTRLPVHHRRVADELLAVGLSLAAALAHGYVTFSSRETWNKALGPSIPFWNKPWDEENGPDYVLDDGNGNFAFFEIKGRATDCTRTPASFMAYKAQSVNAELAALAVRHVLSYAYLPGSINGARINVRWFNAATYRDRSPDTNEVELRRFLSLAIAYSNFSTLISNAGYTMAMLESDSVFEAFEPGTRKRYWIERRDIKLKLLILDKARRCFIRIGKVLQQFREAEVHKVPSTLETERLGRALAALSRKREGRLQYDEPRGFDVTHRYAVGVFVVREAATATVDS